MKNKKLTIFIAVLVMPFFFGTIQATADTATLTTYNSFTYPMKLSREGWGSGPDGTPYTQYSMKYSEPIKVGVTYRAIYQGSSQVEAKIQITEILILAGVHPEKLPITEEIRIKIKYPRYSDGMMQEETLISSTLIQFTQTTSASNWQHYIGWNVYPDILGTDYTTTNTIHKDDSFYLWIERHNPPQWDYYPIQMSTAHFTMLNDPNYDTTGYDYLINRVALFTHSFFSHSYQGIKFSTMTFEYMGDAIFWFPIPAYPSSGGGGGGCRNACPQ